MEKVEMIHSRCYHQKWQSRDLNPENLTPSSLNLTTTLLMKTAFLKVSTFKGKAKTELSVMLV